MTDFLAKSSFYSTFVFVLEHLQNTYYKIATQLALSTPIDLDRVEDDVDFDDVSPINATLPT